MGTPLGDFLRAKRDTTPPAAVGLPAGARRRAPGLRRAELATLAGVSVEYLVRIEQGRDRNPSITIVNALADALRLDLTEREHLRYLTKITGGACDGAPLQPRTDVRPSVLAVLHQLEPGMAMITNRLGDVLAHTTAFALVAGPSGLLDVERPNLTRFVFADQRARDTFPEWDHVADQQAFDLRRGPSMERATRFTTELAALAGDELRPRLDRHVLPAGGLLRWSHPLAGELRFHREVMELPVADAQQLVVFVPADPATEDAMGRLRRAGGTTLRAIRPA